MTKINIKTIEPWRILFFIGIFLMIVATFIDVAGLFIIAVVCIALPICYLIITHIWYRNNKNESRYV